MKFPGHEKYKMGHLFEIEEFIPVEIFKQYGKKSLWFIDQGLVVSFFWLREYFDASIILNDKYRGGKFNYRVFRPRSIKPAGGGELSQHYAKYAGDFNVAGLTSDEVGKRIIDDQKLILENTEFTTIENPSITPGWTHLDKRWTNQTELLIVGGAK